MSHNTRLTMQILSDLHLEFFPAGQDLDNIIDGFVPKYPVDVLILAGDIASSNMLFNVLEQFSDRYREVVFVFGNHEFYGSNFSNIREYIQSIQISNLHVLDNTCIEIQGHRFIGTSLWFGDDPMNTSYRQRLTDFHRIEAFALTVKGENRRAVEFLRGNVRTGDIVVTHYLPTTQSVAVKFQNDPMAQFFICDLEDFILEKQPLLWIHGHTHESFDYRICGTRIICNPFGYPNYQENPTFNRQLVISIDDI